MKGILTLALFGVLISANGYANGGRAASESNMGTGKQDMRRGTSAVDETYTDELKTKKSAIDRQEKSQEKMRENPRNTGMAGSFGQIDSKEDEQQRQQEKLKDKPGGEAETENPLIKD